MWIISNRKNIIRKKLNNSQEFIFYTDQYYYKESKSGIIILVDGYVFPRKGVLNDEQLHEFIQYNYYKYGEDFIKLVKGNFTILILEPEQFYVFSDNFAIKKYFYWQERNEFIISNELIKITSNINVKASIYSVVIYSLTYHFTRGTTLFSNIHHNLPSEVIYYSQKGLKIVYYWSPAALLNQPKKEINIANISKSLDDAVKLCIEKLNLEKISLSLTGGADTRNLLAIFLKNGLRPHLYTYGNPNSNDCKKAAIIAKKLKLDHSVHDIVLDPSLFERYARRIIKHGGGLASIHRAHRLMAVERESQYAESMFLGTLGGEFIKGVSEDDYIVSSLVYENWDKNLGRDNLSKHFTSKRLKVDEELLNNVKEFLNSEPYFKGSSIIRKHSALSYVTAHLHDAQDINLYDSIMHQVFTPFLDIDYLETLFSSNFTFYHKEKINNKSLKRINNPVYGSKFLNETYKPLTKFRYCGEHKPSEVLFNKYYAAAMKAVRKKVSPKYPPNFPLGNWMEQFVEENLPVCKDYPILRETYDIDKLILDLKSEDHIPKESYWLKFTNPIMMRFILEEYNV